MPLKPTIHTTVIWLFALVLATFALSRAAHAQCDGAWTPGDQIIGVNGTVYAMTRWDADGPGPAPELIVVGGYFTTAGSAVCSNVAAYNPQTRQWSALGAGIPGNYAAAVRGLGVLPNGHGGYDIVAAGKFNVQTSSPGFNNVARFDGTSWVPMGLGLNRASNGEAAECLVVMPDGAGGHDVIVGGAISGSGSTTINCLARWHNGAWTSLGGGVSGLFSVPKVSSLLTLPNQQGGLDLIVGGSFASAGGVNAFCLARWNGSSWTALCSTMSNYDIAFSVRALLAVPRPDGQNDLLIGGEFISVNGVSANNIARWNGSEWSAVGAGRNAPVNALAMYPSGPQGEMEFYAGDSYYNGAYPAFGRISRFNGTTWQYLGDGLSGFAYCLSVVGDELFVGGAFSRANGVWAGSVARWNGSTITSTNPGTNVYILALATAPNAQGGLDLYGGGNAGTFAVSSTAGVARRDGDAWTPIGGPSINGGAAGTTKAMLLGAGAQGQPPLTVGGSYQDAAGNYTGNVLHWGGTAWASPGVLGDSTNALCTFPNAQGTRNIIAACASGPWKLTGSTWSRMGTVGSQMYALATRTAAGGTEELYLGGSSSVNIRRWNGTDWATVGQGLNGNVRALAVLPDGAGGSSLIAGGEFSASGSTALNSIARWNGTAWLPLGSGMNGGVMALDVVPNASGGYTLVAGGYFTTAGGTPAQSIARWNGSTWSPMGGGMNNTVYALAHRATPDGGMDIYAGGQFTSAGPYTSAYFARWHTPATADIGATGGVPGHDGLLDNNDFIVFINRFFELDPAADRGIAGGVPGSDGLFDNNDFIVYIDFFFQGC